MGDVAHAPGGGVAPLHLAVLVHQHQRKAARAQPLAHLGPRRRIGVSDDHHVAFFQRRKVSVDPLHLALEGRVVGRIGKDHDGPLQPQEIIKRHTGSINRPKGGRILCSGSQRQKTRQNKDVKQFHAGPLRPFI